VALVVNTWYSTTGLPPLSVGASQVAKKRRVLARVVSSMAFGVTTRFSMIPGAVGSGCTGAGWQSRGRPNPPLLKA
jgi:hypothetical protein